MMIVSQFRQLNLSVVNVRTYLFAVLFVGGNMLLPQLCHLMPDGGKIFFTDLFFTLIASYKFGLKVGILTAVLSPLCNHLLFGMPPAGMLPVLLVKSTLLALVGAIVADRSQRVSFIACRCGGGGLSGARWYSRMVDRFGFVCCIARF